MTRAQSSRRPSDPAALFNPNSVAILGGSADPQKAGFILVDNMRRTRFAGRVYPISRSSSEILGFRAYQSLAELPETPDLVLVSVPAHAVQSVLQEAGELGVKAAVVLTAGFAETDADGRARQDALSEISRTTGLRIVGPNCLGICDVGHGLNATYFTEFPSAPGSASVVSQSGAFAWMSVRELTRSRVGVAKLASVGNMVDVDHAELIRYFADDGSTRVIGAFVEGASSAERLLEAVRDVSPRKAVVILKGGTTPTGQRAALSHTASLAGDDAVWTALLEEAGALVAKETEDFFDMLNVLGRIEPRPGSRRNAAILTLSGGPSVIAADACHRHDITLPHLEPELTGLRDVVSPLASLKNPVDLTGQGEHAAWSMAAAAVADSPAVDAVIALNVGVPRPDFAEALTRVPEGGTPLVAHVVNEPGEQILLEAGVPNFPSPERAVRAAARVMDRAAIANRPPPEEPRVSLREARGPLTSAEVKELLEADGPLFADERSASDWPAVADAALELGYPLALKLSPERVAHKSDVGGLRLGLSDEAELRDAYDELVRDFGEGELIVQRMIGAGVELIVGAVRDAVVGPYVMVGIGGVLAEIMRDVSFAAAPVSAATARAAIARLRAQSLLDGYRGAEPVDVEALAALLERLSAVLVANPAIEEIELNPLIASAGRLTAVDLLVRTTASGDDGHA